MKKLIITAVALLATVACQKDYYLEDLNEAERQIAQLESINKAKQDTINNLKEVIDALYEDLAEANEYVLQLLDDLAFANGEIAGLENVVAIKVANIELLEGIVEEQEIVIDSLSNLTQVQATTIDSLNADIVDFKESIIDFQSQVASLTADLEYLRENPVTIYVTRVSTVVRTNVVTNNIYHDDIAISLNAVRWPYSNIQTVEGSNTATVDVGSSHTFTISVQPNNVVSNPWTWGQSDDYITNPSNWIFEVDTPETATVSFTNLRKDGIKLLVDVVVNNTEKGDDTDINISVRDVVRGRIGAFKHVGVIQTLDDDNNTLTFSTDYVGEDYHIEIHNLTNREDGVNFYGNAFNPQTELTVNLDVAGVDYHTEDDYGTLVIYEYNTTNVILSINFVIDLGD